jgi:hypothetical protein
MGWMVAFGSVMAVEKNLPWDRRLSTPLGILLLAVGVGMFAATSAQVRRARTTAAAAEV